MHKNGVILPVVDDLNVVATVDRIIGWDGSGIVRPIYNAQRHISNQFHLKKLDI